jgi:LysR family hydrogen peroxide-inducible transcriptional activator
MELRQLTALIAVAETGSFSAAARALHTVQSNVSTHIARLEREVGATLVDRSSGTLTEEGVAVVRRARHVQHELDSLTADVAALRDEVTGQVRFGCIGTVGRWLVPLVLEHLALHHPKVRVVVVDATTTSLVPRLLSDNLDLAVVNLPLSDPDLLTDPLFDEDRIVIAPDGHPLAALTRVTMADLGQHELLLEPVGTSFRDELDAEATAAGVTLRARAEVDGLRLITSLAFEGFGAAIVPATAAPPWLEGRWRRVAVDGLAQRSVGLARRRRGLLSAPARALQAAVTAVITDDSAHLDGVHPVGPQARA